MEAVHCAFEAAWWKKTSLRVLQSQSVASCLAKEGNIANTPTSLEELR
jgi:hypothetical protein